VITLQPPLWLTLLACAPVAAWAIERGAARVEPDPGGPTAATAIPWPIMLALAAGVALAAASLAAPQAWAAAGLGWILLALARIDLAHGLLPDLLTLPLALAGIGWTALDDPARVPAALLGAAAGFGVLAGLGWAYRRWRGRDGLGLGDAKLLGAGGAWLGIEALPLTVGLAAVTALVAVLACRLAGRPLDRDRAVPFGPFLGAAVWLVFLLGEGILPA
jgi:leader peptidase (prepilin peptidase)/N-methyltransferase